MSDTHCGCRSGLTPPDFWYNIIKNPKTILEKTHNKYALIQREMWSWYISELKTLGKIDYLFHLGDAIDGTGYKNGGIELLSSDIDQQCEIAAKCIKQANAKEIVMIHGTNYHTGEHETKIAEMVGAKIGNHEFVSVYGNIFDLRHKAGRSSVPYSVGNMPKQKLWNLMYKERDQQPSTNIMLRGHTHYDSFTGDSKFLAVSLPGLQGISLYGIKECSPLVSIGLTSFDVYENGEYSWKFHIANLPYQKVNVISL